MNKALFLCGILTSQIMLVANDNILKKECENGDPFSCNTVALNSTNNKEIVEYTKKANELFIKKCDDNNTLACGELARNYYNKAIELFKKACDSDIADACNMLGGIYEGGSPALPRNYEIAMKLYQKACDNEDDYGCEQLDQIKNKISTK